MTHWSERHTVIPAVYLILRRGNQVLCIRRANTGYRDGEYGLPSGHLEGGETAVAAMMREAKEEVGITIKPADLHLVHTQHRRAEEGTHERIDLYFEATTWQGEPRNMEPDKCDDVQWFPADKLPETMIPSVRAVIDKASKGVPYSDENF